METLEERNLNRLRRGKMMLEFGEVRKSPVLTFVLAFFLGFVGAHRFYLEQTKLGVGIIVFGFISVSLLVFFPNLDAAFYPMLILYFWLVSEVVLSPFYASRVNRQTKVKLNNKYGVLDK
jgi:TM2 domain-containing membrane protein YozV